jgi:hypothetical protein
MQAAVMSEKGEQNADAIAKPAWLSGGFGAVYEEHLALRLLGDSGVAAATGQLFEKHYASRFTYRASVLAGRCIPGPCRR